MSIDDSFDTSNGIHVQAKGHQAANGDLQVDGSYSYTAPDGSAHSLSYVADVNGFVPQSADLPVAPALPALPFVIQPGPNGTLIVSGSYSYTAPDGSVHSLSYVADDKGYRPVSADIPVVPV